MRIAERNWMQVEAGLERDDRAVLPVGSTEQHAYLSLATDSILAERVAAEAADPLGVPVFPVLAYGVTPSFMAYPGTVSLRFSTFVDIVRDLLDSLVTSGFRRILIVNGHGGNTPALGFVARPGACGARRRQLRRPLSAPRCRPSDAVARGGRGDPRRDRRPVGERRHLRWPATGPALV